MDDRSLFQKLFQNGIQLFGLNVSAYNDSVLVYQDSVRDVFDVIQLSSLAFPSFQVRYLRPWHSHSLMADVHAALSVSMDTPTISNPLSLYFWYASTKRVFCAG